MKVVAVLVVALIALGSAQKLSAQQTTVLIDLSQQTAYLIENGRVALMSPIASGKDGWGTPTGKFRVINKDLNHTSADFGLIVDA
ncbi:MAG: L,D-transpeptidase, partial [Verrucomicrobia bacterium]|nr:L,D-transpeptidase [Verrucomicrobiota bacterium]